MKRLFCEILAEKDRKALTSERGKAKQASKEREKGELDFDKKEAREWSKTFDFEEDEDTVTIDGVKYEK